MYSAHLEDALFDAEAGFLLVDPVDPAHLLRDPEQFRSAERFSFRSASTPTATSASGASAVSGSLRWKDATQL